jgi:hypothetical protein
MGKKNSPRSHGREGQGRVKEVADGLRQHSRSLFRVFVLPKDFTCFELGRPLRRKKRSDYFWSLHLYGRFALMVKFLRVLPFPTGEIIGNSNLWNLLSPLARLLNR